MYTRKSSVMLVLGTLLFMGSVVTTTGCFHPKVATTQKLQQLGTRRYPGRSVEEVRAAVITGLKLQGYQIVTEQPMVRTAPKLVAVTSMASGTAYTASAQSYGESVAWDIDVQPQADSIVVTAKHRASVNGMAMEQVYESWADTNYKQLFEAIDSSLPKTPTAAAAAPAAATPPVAATPAPAAESATLASSAPAAASATPPAAANTSKPRK